MPTLRILSARDQMGILTMEEAIDLVAAALIEFSAGRADAPTRLALPVTEHNGTSLFMPALVARAGGLGVKFISVFPHNKALGKPTVTGVLVLADVQTAEPVALLEASYLTALRTGAATALATRLLAREDARTVAIIGTGAQAPWQLQGIMAVREVEEVRLYNHHPDKAYRCSQTIEAQLPPGKRPRIVVCLTPEDVVQGADIVVTATDSHTPVFPPGLVEPGMHVNAIGSFRPTMQELPPGVISPSAKVVVESRQVALEETGDLVIPVRDGLFRPEDIYAELGEIAAGKKPGRVSADEVTVFKLVGLAAMDMVVGRAIYDRAVAMGMGREVDLG